MVIYFTPIANGSRFMTPHARHSGQMALHWRRSAPFSLPHFIAHFMDTRATAPVAVGDAPGRRERVRGAALMLMKVGVSIAALASQC